MECQKNCVSYIFFHGKGNEKRANQSDKEKANRYNDPVAKTDWKPAKNNRETFKDEARRIRQDDGGVKSNQNYNIRNSPGEKYLQQDNDETAPTNSLLMSILGEDNN